MVRDARVWSAYLDEAIDLFAAGTDVAFASHHWPTWGGDRVVEYLSLQRDLYAYLHDQTLRLMNTGLNGTEAAEALEPCHRPSSRPGTPTATTGRSATT